TVLEQIRSISQLSCMIASRRRSTSLHDFLQRTPGVWKDFTEGIGNPRSYKCQCNLVSQDRLNGRKTKMTKRSAAFCLIALSCALLVTAAQSRPDFSGTWKQSMEKSPTKSSWLKSYVNKIELKDPNLKVTTVTVGDRGERTYERTYVIGKEEKSQDREGDQFTTNVKWEGDTLVFDTVEKERDAVLNSKEIWTLSENGKTLTKSIHRSGPRGDSDQQYVLEKQ